MDNLPRKPQWSLKPWKDIKYITSNTISHEKVLVDDKKYILKLYKKYRVGIRRLNFRTPNQKVKNILQFFRRLKLIFRRTIVLQFFSERWNSCFSKDWKIDLLNTAMIKSEKKFHKWLQVIFYFKILFKILFLNTFF